MGGVDRYVMFFRAPLLYIASDKQWRSMGEFAEEANLLPALRHQALPGPILLTRAELNLVIGSRMAFYKELCWRASQRVAFVAQPSSINLV